MGSQIASSTDAYRRSLSHVYVGFWAATLIAIIVSAWALMHLHSDADGGLILTAQSLAVSVGQTIEGKIDTIDMALLASADEIGRQMAGGKPDRRSVTEFLVQQQKRVPHLNLLRATDEKGVVIYGDGVPFPATVTSSIADRDYFQQLRDKANPGLVIEKPIIGRLSHKWLWPFVRRINKPDGSFGGVVYGSIFIDDLAKVLSQLKMGRNSVVALRDANMAAVARSAFGLKDLIQIGDTRLSMPTQKALAVNQQEGMFRSDANSIDGFSRWYAYQRSARYGFTVFVGVPFDSVLNDWKLQAAFVVTILVLFILAAIVYARKTKRDIISRMAIEVELEAARLKSESESQAKSRFLASASHDLRQPAHALGMFVARLAELPGDTQTKHLAGCIDASVRAMQDMLDGFFDISMLDSEQTNFNRVAFPIEGILGRLRGSFANAASEKGLRFRVRPSPAWVESDPNLLHRILLNLVSNAVRYTQQGSILVACRPTYDGTRLRIEIRDSGVGIAAQHHEEIFQEFFQLQNPERDRSKGLGVGLSIVDRACRLLNHPLVMRSASGRGTCFTLTVPLAPPQESGTLKDTRELQASGELNGLRVLLIEDDPLGRVGLASLLASWGCSVTTAEGANAACDLYRQNQAPDITISDFRLSGGIDGIQTVDMLSAIAGQRIVACLISGDTDANVRRQALDAGLTLLQKPVRPAKLRRLLWHLVQLRSVQSAIE